MGTTAKGDHVGHKIVRIRELRGMKQETLASILGVTQQTISRMEQSEQIDDERLKAVADALGVTPEAIRQFNEEALFNNIQNNSDTASNNFIVNYQFNPIDKIVDLYERLLQSEREKVEMLKGLMENTK
ncbi:MAG: XRE family transcriptional regulator [Proteobacteria bacterium]|nr:MAG: XRE family transcriptional regulator [Pseudomonadota bacterium]